MDLSLSTFFWDSFDRVQWALTIIRWDIVFTTLATFLAVWFAAHLREKRTAKADHFRVLRKEVIDPILTKLTSYHLPLLQLNRPIIIAREIPVEEESAVVISPPIQTNRRELAISSIGSLITMDQILYADAKRNHFKKFVRKWEKYEEKVSSFHGKCLEVTAEYETMVRNLSRHQEDPRTVRDEGFVNATGIAAWIFNKQMGIFSYKYLDKGEEQHKPNRMWIRDPGSGHNLAVGDREHIEGLLDLINKLVPDKSKTTELLGTSATLAKEGRQLASEAKDILHRAGLKGGCKYY